jgi:hypothetical protein
MNKDYSCESLRLVHLSRKLFFELRALEARMPDLRTNPCRVRAPNLRDDPGLVAISQSLTEGSVLSQTPMKLCSLHFCSFPPWLQQLP